MSTLSNIPGYRNVSTAEMLILLERTEHSHDETNYSLYSRVTRCDKNGFFAPLDAAFFEKLYASLMDPRKAATAFGNQAPAIEAMQTRVASYMMRIFHECPTAATISAFCIDQRANIAALVIASRMLTHEYMKLLRVEDEEYKRVLVIINSRIEVGNPIPDAELPKRFKTYITLTAAYRWLAADGIVLIPVIRAPVPVIRVPVLNQQGNRVPVLNQQGNRTPVLNQQGNNDQKRRTSNMPISSSAYVYGKEAYSTSPGIQSTVEERRISRSEGPLSNSPQLSTSKSSNLPDLFSIIGNQIPNVANLKIEYHENGHPVFRVCDEVIRPQFKYCSVHSGKGISNLPILSQEKVRLFFGAYGYRDKHGSCYDICHSFRQIPMEESETSRLITDTDKLSDDLGIFKTDANNVSRLIETINSLAVKRNELFDRLNSQNELLQEMICDKETITDVVKFLSKGIFERVVETTISDRRRNTISRNVQQTPNIVSSQLYSSFFGLENEVFQNVERVGVDFFFGVPSEDDVVEFQNFSIVFDIESAKKILVFFNGFDYRHSGYLPLGIKNTVNGLVFEDNDSNQMQIPKSALDSISEALYCTIDNLVNSTILLEARPSYSAAILRESNNIKPSYETNCYNAGFNFLRKIGFSQIYADVYGDENFRMFTKPWEKCVDVGAALLGNNTILLKEMVNPTFFMDNCSFGGKVNIPLTREFVDAIESSLGKTPEFATIPFNGVPIKSNMKVIRIGEIDGKLVYLSNGSRDIVLSSMRNDIAKVGIIESEDDEDADSKFTSLNLKAFPICIENFDFLFSNLFSEIAYRADGDYDHIRNSRDFILTGLLCGLTLDTVSSEINFKTQFKQNHTVRLDNRVNLKVPFLKICSCSKLITVVNAVKEIDRMTVSSLQTMISKVGDELFTGMFAGYCSNTGGFYNSIDNNSFVNHISRATTMIGRKIEMKLLLEEVNFMIVNSMVDYDCSANVPTGFYEKFKNVCFFVDDSPDNVVNDSALPQVPFYSFSASRTFTSFIPIKTDEILSAKYSTEMASAKTSLGFHSTIVVDRENAGFNLLRRIFPSNSPIFISDIMPKASDIMKACSTLVNMPSFLDVDDKTPRFSNLVELCRLNAACTIATNLAESTNVERGPLKEIVERCDTLIDGMTSGAKLKIKDLTEILGVEGATSVVNAIDLCIGNIISLFDGIIIEEQNLDEMFLTLMTFDFDVIRPYRLRRARSRQFLADVLGMFKLDMVKRTDTGDLSTTSKSQFINAATDNDIYLSTISASIKSRIKSLELKPTCLYDNGRDTDIPLLSLSERLMIADLFIPTTLDKVDISKIVGAVATYCVINHPEIFESRFYYRYGGLKYKKNTLVSNKFSDVFGGENGINTFKTNTLSCETFRDSLKELSVKNSSTMVEFTALSNDIVSKTKELKALKDILQGRFINKAAIIHAVLSSYKRVKTENSKFQLKIKALEDIQTSLLRRMRNIDLSDVKTLLNVYDFADLFYKSRKDLYKEFKFDTLERFNRVFKMGSDYFSTQFKSIDTSLSISGIVHMKNEVINDALKSINSNCSIERSISSNLSLINRLDTESQDTIMKFFVAKAYMDLLSQNFYTLYDLTAKERLDDIVIEDFPSARKMPGFYQMINTGAEQQFSTILVDAETKRIFNEKKEVVSNFIISVLDSLTIVDCGPGMHFIVEFLRTSLEYYSQLEEGTQDIEATRINLDEIKNRLTRFVDLDALLLTSKLPSFVSVINGTFSKFINYTSNLPEMSNANLEMSDVTEEVVKQLIQLIQSFELTEENSCSRFDSNLSEIIDAISSETFRHTIICFGRYIDEYIGLTANGEIVLNDDLVFELRETNVLCSRGTCLNPLFLNANRYLNLLIGRGRNELTKSVVGVFREYISNMSAGFNSLPALETFVIKRYL